MDQEPIVEDSEVGWKLTLSYDGTDFHGWQIQPGMATIQGMLQDAIAAITGEQVLPQGSGRTDAGVHAWGQVASFPLHAAIPAENLLRALNRRLPAAVRVLSAQPAPAGFHARHSAVGKVYQYRIFRGRICSPFLSRYVSAFRWPLDLEAMQLAANAVLGEHDFTSFAASDPERSARLAAANTSHVVADELGSISTTANNVRRIETSQWTREFCIPFPQALESATGSGSNYGDTPATSEGEQILTYTVCGNGFLHHMVRNLVGTFLEVGRGRLAADEITSILQGRNRALAGPTAPARGLCLVKVLY